MDNFYNALISAVGMHKVLCNEPMDKHTTFRIGGNADYYVPVTGVSDLVSGIRCCRDNNVPVYVLGNGSNVLVSDDGIRGSVKRDNEQVFVTAEAGCMLGTLGKYVLEEGLTGFEWAAGIPGTVGGAVYMNAGAYGGEMKDIVTEATVLTNNLNVETRTLEELDLGYRSSALMREKSTLLTATFVLKTGERSEIQAKMAELAAKRREKQPLEYPSAGSTFKRPEGYFAGKLIQDAGLRGYQVGGAQVSEKHCGFVINKGNATAQDVYNLIQEVSKRVADRFGVKLEPEVRLLGKFS